MLQKVPYFQSTERGEERRERRGEEGEEREERRGERGEERRLVG